MPRKKRGEGQHLSEGGGQGAGSGGPEDLPLDQPEGIFDRMQEDSYVLLKRRNPRTQQFEFVSRITPEQTQEEFVQEKFGGGDYFFQERIRTTEGKFIFGRSRSIKILGEPKAVVLAPAEAPAGVADAERLMSAGKPTTGGNIQNLMEMGILQIFESMQNASKMQMMMFTKMLEAGKPQQNDRLMELLLQIVLDKKSGGDSSAETMRLAKEIAELAAPKGGGDRRSVSDVIAEMRELKDAAGILGIGEGGEEADSWLGVAKQFAPVIADALKGQTIVRRGPKALAPGDPNVSVVELIRPAVPKLVETAKLGRDPVVYAQVAVDNMPAGVQKLLRDFLAQGREAALTKWWAAFPDTTHYREWFIVYATTLSQLLGVSWVEGGGEAPAPAVEGAGLPKVEPSL